MPSRCETAVPATFVATIPGQMAMAKPRVLAVSVCQDIAPTPSLIRGPLTPISEPPIELRIAPAFGGMAMLERVLLVVKSTVKPRARTARIVISTAVADAVTCDHPLLMRVITQ